MSLKDFASHICQYFRSAPDRNDGPALNGRDLVEASIIVAAPEGAVPALVNATAIQEHIPRYLTLDQREALAQALNKFPTNSEYYLIGKYTDELLQGDGWTKMQVLRFDTGERKNVLEIIFSNTCDIIPENKRDVPTNIVFAPILKLSNYVDLLRRAGLAGDRIGDKIASIKAQQISTIFYLPDAVGSLSEEHIVLLDDVHTMPSSAFQGAPGNTKTFTLSNLGFYIFIFKLSMHFCRLREDVSRA